MSELDIREALNSLVRQCENSHECWEAGRTDCFCVSTAAGFTISRVPEGSAVVPVREMEIQLATLEFLAGDVGAPNAKAIRAMLSARPRP